MKSAMELVERAVCKARPSHAIDTTDSLPYRFHINWEVCDVELGKQVQASLVSREERNNVI